MKPCKICKTEKPLEEFHASGPLAGYKDNRVNTCKECQRPLNNTYYRRTWFKSQARMKAYECRKKNIPFDLDEEYLKTIWTNTCPIFGFEFVLFDKGHNQAPSLDRIDPKGGYVKGNVCYISARANRIKYDATIEELRKILEWYEGATTISKESTPKQVETVGPSIEGEDIV